MKEIFSILMLTLLFSFTVNAQKFFTRTGQVSFHSRALLEDIDAFNNQGTFVLDEETGKIQMAVLIKSFQFEKALMQEHFNENYMESDEYPKAVFSGEIIGGQNLDLSKDGSYGKIGIKGNLTIRGIKKPLETQADFIVKNGKVDATTSFNVKVADYKISIPSIVKDKIAKEVEVKISVSLDKM